MPDYNSQNVHSKRESIDGGSDFAESSNPDWMYPRQKLCYSLSHNRQLPVAGQTVKDEEMDPGGDEHTWPGFTTADNVDLEIDDLVGDVPAAFEVDHPPAARCER